MILDILNNGENQILIFSPIPDNGVFFIRIGGHGFKIFLKSLFLSFFFS